MVGKEVVMSEARILRRKIARGEYAAPKSKFKEMEEALQRGGTPSDMYALIPERQRKAFESFARCFGITKGDIERIVKG